MGIQSSSLTFAFRGRGDNTAGNRASEKPKEGEDGLSSKPVSGHCLLWGSLFFFFFFNKFYLFIYFWLHWVFVAARRLSLVVASGGYSSLPCAGFSLQWLILLWSTGSRHAGLVAPRHVGSSRTRARTRVPCLGRRILNHCAKPWGSLLIRQMSRKKSRKSLKNAFHLFVCCLPVFKRS